MRLTADFYALLGSLNFVNGNLEKAAAYYQKAVNRKTRTGVAYLNYAILLLQQGEWQAALELLETGMRFKHNIVNDKNMIITMASCHWVGGDISGAIRLLEGLRAKYEYISGDALTTLGYMYLLEKNYEKATYFSELAIEDNPQSGAAWDNIGQIYFRKNEYSNAKEAFERAVSFNQGLPESLYYLGVIAENEGDCRDAKGYFEKASHCRITALNTVSREQIEAKYKEYFDK